MTKQTEKILDKVVWTMVVLGGFLLIGLSDILIYPANVSAIFGFMLSLLGVLNLVIGEIEND